LTFDPIGLPILLVIRGGIGLMGVYLRHGRYCIDYTLPNGKRKRESIGPDKKLAETVLYKRKLEIAEGKYLDIKKEQKIGFDSFADEYIELYAKTNNIAWKCSIVPNMKALKRFFVDKTLAEITPHLIEKFKVERVKEVSPAATNRALTLLKSMFNRANEWNKFDGHNPVTKVKFLREANHKLRYLEKDEIKRLIDTCEDFIRPLIIVAVNTGLRKAELFNLKWRDINLNKGIIHLLRTKNGEKREVPMNQAVQTVIMNIIRNSQSEYVFCNSDGKPYVDIRIAFAKSLKRAGIENFRWHDLRKTFASQLAMASVDLNTIRELLGHSSIRMTLVYAGLSSNHKNRAVELLNSCLESTVDTFPSPSIIVESKMNNLDVASPSIVLS
jgi:integrase